MVNSALGVLRTVYHPDGFNVGIDMGSAAGAGVAEHAPAHPHCSALGWRYQLHVHIGETRVLPEELEESFKRISAAWRIDMKNHEITRKEIIETIREYDKKGKRSFLREYGFQKSRRYFLWI